LKSNRLYGLFVRRKEVGWCIALAGNTNPTLNALTEKGIMHDGKIPSKNPSVKDSLSEATLTAQFLTENGISLDGSGVEALVSLEITYRRLNLNPQRLHERLAPGLEAFLKERGERLQKEKSQEQHRKTMQERAMELSRASDLTPTVYRNDHHIMRFPIFSTSQGKRLEPIHYEFTDRQKNRRFLTVTANATYGMADQRDGDIIRYVITKIGEIGMRTGYFPCSVEVTAYELLKTIGKDDRQQSYEWLECALNRLATTCVHTNVFTKNPADPAQEYLGSLVSFDYLKPQGRIRKISITLSRSLFISAACQGLLKIDQAILLESGNLRKALLERIKVHMGVKDTWMVGLKKLAALCAFQQPMKRFKEAITRAKLPYTARYHKNSLGEEIITFTAF
jgi:hypothetical protein